MFTTQNQGLRRGFGTVAAMAVVVFAAMTVEFGHANTLPRGTVEIGELQPVNLEQLAMVTLPGLVISAEREPVTRPAPAIRDLPDNEVRLAQASTPDGTRG